MPEETGWRGENMAKVWRRLKKEKIRVGETRLNTSLACSASSRQSGDKTFDKRRNVSFALDTDQTQCTAAPMKRMSAGKSQKEDKSTKTKSEKKSKREKEKSPAKGASKSTKEKEKSATRSSKKIIKSEPMLRLLGSAYFLEWQQTAFQAYTRSINELFLKPLMESVYKTKIKEDPLDFDFSTRERAALSKGPQADSMSDHMLLKEKLKAAAQSNWDDGLTASAGELKATLAEICAVQRLRNLVQMSGSLLEVLQRTNTWVLKNIEGLARHASTFNILPYVTYSFEAVSALSEVFGLMSVDRSKCKAEFIALLRDNKEKRDKNNSIRIDEKDVRAYVKHLEGQINCYRASVYLVGTCLAATIQCISRVIGNGLEIKTSEVNQILDRLPAPYLFPGELKLSAYVKDLMEDAPPRRTNIPMPPKGKDMDVSHRTRDESAFSDASVEDIPAAMRARSRSPASTSIGSEEPSKRQKSGKSSEKKQKSPPKLKESTPKTCRNADSPATPRTPEVVKSQDDDDKQERSSGGTEKRKSLIKKITNAVVKK